MAIEWDINPEIVNIFGLISIRYYSLLFMLGLLLGIATVKRIWVNEGLAISKFEKLTVYVFLATIIGARLGHCLFYEPSYYLYHPLEIILPFNFHNGNFNFTGYQGLASHGGILAVFMTVLAYCYKNNLSFFSIIDKVSIGGAMTAVFIRVGNFMNSEIIGKATNTSFGVIFKRVDNVIRHPSQLYEALAYLVIFCIILYVYRMKSNRQDGFVFGLFFTLLFIARFSIEFTKINQVGFENGMPINMGQLLSVPFIILGLTIMVLKGRTNLNTTRY